MSKYVYIITDLVQNEVDTVTKLLKEKGFDVLVSVGKINDEYLKLADALVPGREQITAEVLDKAPNLQLVSKFGVGMDRIDIDACTKRGIYVCNTPTANFVSVAEHTVALMMAAAKKIYQISQYLRLEYPAWEYARHYQATELSGKTLSLIGFGNIGSRVAKLLSTFEMRIIAYDPYIDEAKIPEYVELTRDFEYALRSGDFVSIHVAGESSTRHLINAKELHMMKPTSIIINTSRGFIIDESALIEALRDGTIGGAALDVFTEEPIGKGNPLIYMENVVATPHIAANTPESRLRAQLVCAENIIACFETGRPPHPLNTPIGRD